MEDQLIHIENIGDVWMRNSKIAKQLNISIQPFKGIIVSIPSGVSLKQAIALVNSKKEWINKKRDHIKIAEGEFTVFDENTEFRTRNHILTIKKWEKKTVFCRVTDREIKVRFPSGMRPVAGHIQTTIRNGIERAWRKEAKEILPLMVDKISKNFNLPYKKLVIKNMKTRWGSCSKDNNINLSLHLMRLPDHLIEYVVAHELCHSKIKDHSEIFWLFLNRIIPKSKKIDKELKINKIQIY